MLSGRGIEYLAASIQSLWHHISCIKESSINIAANSRGHSVHGDNRWASAVNDKGHVLDLKLKVGTIMRGGGIFTVKVTQNALGIVQRKRHCQLKVISQSLKQETRWKVKVCEGQNVFYIKTPTLWTHVMTHDATRAHMPIHTEHMWTFKFGFNMGFYKGCHM